MDLITSTGTICSILFNVFIYFFFIYSYAVINLYYFSGASIRASKSLQHHIITFECDSILYEELLVPHLPQSQEVEFVKVTRISPKKKRPMENEDEPQRKTTAKQSCK